MYSLAGGASEIACDVSPTMETTEYGPLPVGMSNVICDLEDAYKGGDPTERMAAVQQTFKAIAKHLKPYSKLIWKLSRQMRDRRLLDHQELSLVSIDRDTLMRAVTGGDTIEELLRS